MEQISMLDEIETQSANRRVSTTAHARRSDPGTSQAAARSVQHKLRESQVLVLHYLRRFGPMTDDRLLSVMSMWGNSLSPSGARTRRSELVDLGLVVDTGKRETLPSGRSAIVWDAKRGES